MTERRLIRQGDVLFIPKDGIKVKGSRKRGPDVVAQGEATGHAHRATGDFVLVCDEAGKVCGIDVGDGGATVVHEEHNAARLAPGGYEIVIQSEYDPEMGRVEVVD